MIIFHMHMAMITGYQIFLLSKEYTFLTSYIEPPWDDYFCPMASPCYSLFVRTVVSCTLFVLNTKDAAGELGPTITFLKSMNGIFTV